MQQQQTHQQHLASQQLHQSHLQPNAKRFWGEEKNLDSIYSIYLKKISYSYNNGDSQTFNGGTSLKTSFDETDSSVASRNDTHSSSLSQSTLFRKPNNAKDSNLKSNSTPITSTHKRGRQNFFQKYRQRSCSVDKYTFNHSPAKSSVEDLSIATAQTNEFNNSKKSFFKTDFTSSRSTSTPKKQSSSSNKSAITKQATSTVQAKDVTDFKHADLNSSSGSSNVEKQANDFNKSAIDLVSNQKSESQFLQWETRQIKVLQAATLDHVVKFILLIKPYQDSTRNDDKSLTSNDFSLEEERNNVAHIIHVLFSSYRLYTNPHELLMKILDYSVLCCIEQYRFVIQYWMDNYPEDFDYVIKDPLNCDTNDDSISGRSMNISSIEPQSYSSSSNFSSTPSKSRDFDNSNAGANGVGEYSLVNDSEDQSSHVGKSFSPKPQVVTLKEELMRLCKDDFIKKRVKLLIESKQNDMFYKRRQASKRANGPKKSSILDMDSRYVAQQLTAIDLENFLDLKPYTLLQGTKSDKTVRRLIKNFNLLSKQVVVTILKSHTPHFVATHWIAIATNLQKIKNYNSLKAIIAGLTNESIHRLKQLVWAKISKSNMTTFKMLASIVDDVNNQTVLRQTQLIVGGTSKINLEEESFGTVPYLGTFLTDLTMIDARYPNYIPSPKDDTSKLKLINFAKCAKQFEILTQMQLLQKNVLASLTALQKRNYFNQHIDKSKNSYSLAKPAVPQVAKLFENWFFDDEVGAMTDKQCYEMSLMLDQNTGGK